MSQKALDVEGYPLRRGDHVLIEFLVVDVFKPDSAGNNLALLAFDRTDSVGTRPRLEVDSRLVEQIPHESAKPKPA